MSNKLLFGKTVTSFRQGDINYSKWLTKVIQNKNRTEIILREDMENVG